jgi:hypothetical protein
MIKIIILLECDGCNGVLQNIAVAEKAHQIQDEIHNLQLKAKENAWQLMRNPIVHYCAECMRPIGQ